ncbi:MAG TPA: glycosyltransferase family 4 protein [Herpetosiphonaceae bacterium]
MSSLHLLRLTDTSGAFVSGDVFEQAFAASLRHIGVAVTRNNHEEFWSAAQSRLVDSPAPLPERLSADVALFERAFGAYDVICPDYRYLFFAPLLMALRNQARSPVAFCLIAHSPGLYALEWALLAPLLSERDVIIAPSEFARDAIQALNGDLAPYIRVAPHPAALEGALAPHQAPPSSDGRRRPVSLLSLSRIIPTKLIHRQIDALALLRQWGYTQIKLRIAGELCDPTTQEHTPYASVLIARVRRLGLEAHVEFLGTIRDTRQKIALLQASDILLNLSTTLEESFGKALVEALSVGTPALVTRWDGLVEIVGACGGCVDVQSSAATGVLDMDAAALARQVLALLDGSFALGDCRERLQAMYPASAGRRYREVLAAALDREAIVPDAAALLVAARRAAPETGILSRTAPLTVMTWTELFLAYLDELREHQDELHPPAALNMAAQIQAQADAAASARQRVSVRKLLIMATAPYLESFYAYRDRVDVIAATSAPKSLDRTSTIDTIDTVIECGIRDVDATPASRFACLVSGAHVRLDIELKETLKTLFADRSLMRVTVLSALGEWQPMYALCMELTAVPREDQYVLLPALATVGRILKPGDAYVQRLVAWVRAFPDHFYTWVILMRIVETLDDAPMPRPAKLALYDECLLHFETIVARKDLVQQFRHKVTRGKLGLLFQADAL